MRVTFLPFIKCSGIRQFRLPGQHHWRCRPTLWCLACLPAGRFFALHRDYFIMTRNFTAIYVDLLPSHSFTVTRNSLPSTGPDSYRDGKKRGTATLRYRSGQAPTATNQTAGPLVLMSDSQLLKKY